MQWLFSGANSLVEAHKDYSPSMTRLSPPKRDGARRSTFLVEKTSLKPSGESYTIKSTGISFPMMLSVQDLLSEQLGTATKVQAIDDEGTSVDMNDSATHNRVSFLKLTYGNNVKIIWSVVGGGISIHCPQRNAFDQLVEAFPSPKITTGSPS